jgi:hypothetical protein
MRVPPSRPLTFFECCYDARVPASTSQQARRDARVAFPAPESYPYAVVPEPL